jgi:hypothetical protein
MGDFLKAYFGSTENMEKSIIITTRAIGNPMTSATPIVGSITSPFSMD